MKSKQLIYRKYIIMILAMMTIILYTGIGYSDNGDITEVKKYDKKTNIILKIKNGSNKGETQSIVYLEKKGITLVPLRYIAEQLELQVMWCGGYDTIILDSNYKNKFTKAELTKIENFIDIFEPLKTNKNGDFSNENMRDFLVEYYLYLSGSSNVKYSPEEGYIGKKEDVDKLARLYFDKEIKQGSTDKDIYKYKDGKYYRTDGDYGDITFFKVDQIKSIGNNKYIVKGNNVIEDTDEFGEDFIDFCDTVEATIELKDGRYILRNFKRMNIDK